MLSVALTGYPDAALPILLGPPGRGKTALMTLIMSVLGSYADSSSPKLLSGSEGHASIVYALRGLRLAFVDEGPRAGMVATEALKALTGGARLTGNRMRENPVTFKPTHTLVLTANTEPHLVDEGLRRRVRLIPCEGDADAVRTAREAIGDLGGSAWRSEMPGVLAQLMSEAAQWLDDRGSASLAAAPASIRDLADEIASEQDPVATWVEEETEFWAAGTRAGDLYRDFVLWCKERATRPPTATAWGRRLNDLDFERAKRGGVAYRFLRVKPGIGVLPMAPGAGLQLVHGDAS